MMDKQRADVWSFGGGVQSYGILALIQLGELPKPELVVMADTGRERSAVWDYLEEIGRPMFERLGLPFVVVGHEWATVDLCGSNNDLLIPAYSQSSKLPTFCSNEWKRRPFMRYLRSVGYGPERPVNVWLGMSLDEVDRVKKSDVEWAANYYPLLFGGSRRYYRADCIAAIQRVGWPVPPKSACWMCPNRDVSTWREMAADGSGDIGRAIQLEQEIRQNPKFTDVTFHRSRVPLADIDFTAAEEQQPGLFDGFGDCGTACFT